MTANKENNRSIFLKFGRIFFFIIICILLFSKETFAEENNYMTVTYSNNIQSGFLYSDDMMLVNANELSTDIAKMAMGLANAAYKESEIKSCLSNMGYSLLGGDTYNYTKNTYTYSNNDYVDYSIGYKEYRGYNIYLVVIKGTGTNYDWFSNFNLGTGDYHQGFKLAADGVLNTINSKVNTTNNIFLVTGHSRGAAVANIVAAELTMQGNLASSNHIFGYTYACPAVKVGADTSYSNIRNYNNPGDAIPELPLSRWGYERYGITINLSTQNDIYQNFEQRFKSVERKAYAGILNTDSFVSAMQIIANDRSAFYSKENHLLFDIAAYLLGPVSNKNIGFRTDEFAVILKNNDVTGSLKKALTNIISSTISGGLTSATNAQHQADTDFLVLIDAGLDDTMNASEDEVANWISSHSSLCDKIQNDFGIIVDSRSKLVSARSELVSKMNKVSYVTSNLESVYYLYFSTNGNISDAIAHAHQPSTYVLWINSMYYGYKGWYGNNSAVKVVIPSEKKIGDYCYSNCINLVEAVIPDEHDYIGYGVFQNCKELSKVSIAVDYDANEIRNWFEGSQIQEVYYTKGKTGVMPDTKNSTGYDNSYNKRLEYMMRKTLKKVSFEEGITRIGACAYGGWGGTDIYSVHTDLIEINLPDTLLSIGNCAFHGQKSLENIVLPRNVSEIGVRAFGSCRALKRAELPESIETIGTNAFEFCSSFTSTEDVKLPSKMDYIPEGMYYSCYGITEIVIPEGVKIIKKNAYNGLSKVQDLVIPESVEEIYEDAFYGMSNLKKVTIPVDYQYLNRLNSPFQFQGSSVQEIYYTKGKTGVMPDIETSTDYDNSYNNRLEYAAWETLKKVSFEDGITRIGAYAYGYWGKSRGYDHTMLTEINLPATLTSIGRYAFYDQKMLENIVIPENVSEIEEYAFAYCTSFASTEAAKLPPQMDYVPEGMYYGCDGITEIIIPEGIKMIKENAYDGLSKVQELEIPECVEEICATAFDGMGSLTKVTIPVDYQYLNKSGKPFGVRPFSGESPVQEIYYTKGKTGVMPDIDPCTGYDNSFNNRLEYVVRGTLRKVSFEEGITRIGAYAYGYWYKDIGAGCHTDLIEINLPSTLTSIGRYAFNEQENLKNIVIPENVSVIEDWAFGRCKSLKEVKLPEGIETMGRNIFAFCTSFTSTDAVKLSSKMNYIPEGMYYECSGITEIRIPEGVKTIKENAYYGLDKVQELEIPECVEEIYGNAFYGMSSLKKVTIPVDYQYLNKLNAPFQFGESPVQEIYYTKGKSGVMPDIAVSYDYEECDNSYDKRLEYAVQYTLKKVSFEEGITRIGAHAYGNWGPSRYHADLTEINLPKTLISIGKYSFTGQENLENIVIPKNVLEIGESAFARCSSDLLIWGFKNSIAETYAYENGISFRILYYPYVENAIKNVEPGKTYPFTARVYTGINETTRAVIWSVQGSTSENTSIDEIGLLTVADDERAKELMVSATYENETSSIKLSVNIVPTATFVGDISTVIAADGENHIARPIDLEESGYQYSYYLDERQILEDEWPLTIDSDVTINVVKKEMYCHITYHLDGGVNALDNPENYPITNPYIELSDPMKEHYEFLGWYLDENFETQLTQETVLSGDIDVFAKWQGELHTITFNVNGGATLENSIKEVRYGEKLGLLDEATWDNHIFRGWFTSIDGDIQITASTICEGNMTVYAHWSEISDEHKHFYEYYVVINPTCTEAGIGRYTCFECGDSYDEIIEALGHGEKEIRNAVAATTENEGYTGDIYCKVCDALLEKGTVIERMTEEHIHEYQSYVTKEATCLEAGEITYSCECGDVYTEEIPATGHQNIEIKNAKNASCSLEGYSGDEYCADCGTLLEEGQVIEKTDHMWNEGQITTDTTCTEEGIRTFTCIFCGITKTEAIAATGHKATEVRNKKNATCVSEGYSGDEYCADCGTLLEEGQVIEKTDHMWNEGQITTDATCTEEGIRMFTCIFCGITKTEAIAATGHKATEVRNKKNATCVSEGYSGDEYCADCGTLLEEGQAIEKTGHSWNKGQITRKATCTEEGIRTFTCISCKTTKTKKIAATGHGATKIRNKKSATCVSNGYTGDTYCITCNKKISSGNVIAKTNHSWDGGKITKKPTTAKTGIKTYTCRKCSTIKRKVIEKLKHQKATPGKIIKDKSTNGVYKVLKDGLSVEFTKLVSKKTSVRIPDAIKVDGITCKVTGIAANAFKNNISLKNVTIGKNITVIGINAFYGCKKLNKVSGGNGIVKINDRAFAGCGDLRSVTIPETVKSIGKQAFYNCKQLRNITIKTVTLSSKSVGAKAFSGIYKRPTVKVPAKQLKSYKKLLQAKGMSPKAAYKK